MEGMGEGQWREWGRGSGGNGGGAVEGMGEGQWRGWGRGSGGDGGGAAHRDRRYDAGVCTIVISTIVISTIVISTIVISTIVISTNGAFHFADG